MLGKLLKHEFRATGRVFLPFYGAMVVIAIVTRILSGFGFSYETPNEYGDTLIVNSMAASTASIIGIVVTSLLISAVCVIAIILTVQRFNRNLLGDEGYLMFTLPTSTDSLIFSKLIASVVWFIVSGLLAVAALAIAVPDIGEGVLFGLRAVLRELFGNGAVVSTLAVLTILVGLLSVAWFVLSVYAAGSLAMLSNRRRGLVSFGFWIGISILAQIVTSFLVTWSVQIGISSWFSGLAVTSKLLLPGFALFAIMLIADAVLYAATRYMLKKKLNLE